VRKGGGIEKKAGEKKGEKKGKKEAHMAFAALGVQREGGGQREMDQGKKKRSQFAIVSCGREGGRRKKKLGKKKRKVA